ncbi:MAG: type II toxin-antitoxin system death-on-curing family toxin [Promethearchaeati archaeon]
MRWIPSIEYIEALYMDQIKNGVLINRGGLISTLDKVKWGISFKSNPNIWDQVVILYKEIIENHYFSDGNKRIASLIAYVFLYKNDYIFSPPRGEIYETTMEVAQAFKTFEELKIWFKKYSTKK